VVALLCGFGVTLDDSIEARTKANFTLGAKRKKEEEK
jgi:hypothetical protein